MSDDKGHSTDDEARSGHTWMVVRRSYKLGEPTVLDPYRFRWVAELRAWWENGWVEDWAQL